MSFISKRIILFACIFSFLIPKMNAFDNHSNSQPTKIKNSELETLALTQFFVGLISNVIGIACIFNGIEKAYDIPSVPLERIARALEQTQSEEWNKKQQKGRILLGSIIGGMGIASLAFGLLNWFMIAKALNNIKK